MAPVTISKPDGSPLLTFEPEAQYRAANAVEGYWGPVTSSIDWCERNYIVTPYIAEFFNTLSNIGMVLLGALTVYLNVREGNEWRYAMNGCTLFFIGVGSAAFHGTLTHIGQQGDETPMVIGSAAWLWCLAFSDPAFEKAHPQLPARSAVGTTLLVAAFAVLHYVYSFVLVFQGLIAVMVVTMLGVLYVKRRNGPPALRGETALLYRLYMGTILVAFPLWLCDQHFCVHLHDPGVGGMNPQFHAWWHVLMGVNCYLGPVIEAPIRLAAKGKRGIVRYWAGCLPFVTEAGAAGESLRVKGRRRA